MTPSMSRHCLTFSGRGEELDLRGRLGFRRLLGAAARWALLACVAGAVAGVGASLFIAGLNVLIRWVDDLRAAIPWWLIFLFPPVGGLAVGYLLWRTDRGALIGADRQLYRRRRGG